MGSPGFSRYFSTVHGSRSLVFPTTSGRAYYRRPKGMVSLVHGRVLGGSPLSLKGQLPHSRELLLSILVPLQHRPTLFEARAKGDDREREREGETPFILEAGSQPPRCQVRQDQYPPSEPKSKPPSLCLRCLPACLPTRPPAKTCRPSLSGEFERPPPKSVNIPRRFPNRPPRLHHRLFHVSRFVDAAIVEYTIDHIATDVFARWDEEEKRLRERGGCSVRRWRSKFERSPCDVALKSSGDPLGIFTRELENRTTIKL